MLFEDTWMRHVLDPNGHPELEPYLHVVLAAIAEPDHREPDSRHGRERFFKRESGLTTWVMAVVDFQLEPARIVTALGHGHGRSPSGWTT